MNQEPTAAPQSKYNYKHVLVSPHNLARLKQLRLKKRSTNEVITELLQIYDAQPQAAAQPA